MKRVFIDGSAGTTGLRIRERLSARRDIELIALPEALRKDPSARRDALNRADIAFLCLPDAAAVEAVALVENPDTAIIDTSTAHRTAQGWVYGFAELPGQREKIAASKRIANPGCHASGFVALIAPLTHAGLLKPDSLLCCTSLTGYSGGGKKMIAEYEGEGRDPLLDAPRQYGLSQSHKHLPEMAALCHLTRAPAFMPIVADYYAGMLVSVPFATSQLKGISSLAQLHECYADHYAGQKMIRVMPLTAQADVGGFLSSNGCAMWDGLEIYVAGNDERMMVCSRFDNLGKGASGAAIQNMNILLGCDEATGLNL